MLFKSGTKRHAIELLHSQGLNEREAYNELRPKVAEQVKPWVFTSNSPSGRVPKPMADQYVELQHEINRVYNAISRAGKGSPIPASPKADQPTKVEPPKAKGKLSKEDEKRHFLSEWKRLRRWIAEVSERSGALPLDSLDTMRPVREAAALIDAGFSARTLLYAMCLHWPKASRDMANVETVDFLSESEDLGTGIHRLTGYIRKLVSATIVDPKTGAKSHPNAMLIGPAGSGKSYIAKQVASLISTESHPGGLPYAETPMTPGATRGDLLGRHTIGGLDRVIAAAATGDVQVLQRILESGGVGFITSQFVEIYSGGGIFNFEEIDAADPSMLIVVNNALASDRLFNSANGEVYTRHEDFIAVATANTFGMGADSKYTGREKLDLATIDRFRMGRVLVDLDENLAEYLMFGES